MSPRPLLRDGLECPDCGLLIRPLDDHECPALDEAERVFDRWETVRGTAEGER